MTSVLVGIGLLGIVTLAILWNAVNRKTSKWLKLALGLAFVVAGSLFFRPVRLWASEEGAYIYHWLWVNGPATIYTKNTWTDAGGTLHTGLEINSGSYSSRTTKSVAIVGAQTTSARTACSSTIEGQWAYDTTVHSFAFCDGTNWHKLVTGTSTNDSWTSY